MIRAKIVMALALLAFGAAQADEAKFPSNPIHFVIPGAAGSAPDLARAPSRRSSRRHSGSRSSSRTAPAHWALSRRAKSPAPRPTATR